MRIALFYESLVSDWNHGNAHFLRGVATELIERGHDVRVYVPRDGWSVSNLIAERGHAPIAAFHRYYPLLDETPYELDTLDLYRCLDDVDLVVVHEWNLPELVARVGAHRAAHSHFRLLFHDTHHRAVSDPEALARYDLRHYDGVLAFGAVIRELYLANDWIDRAWVWHEAADVRVFHPPEGGAAPEPDGDLVWVGNWGDDERTRELEEFLFGPVTREQLRATVYGVRYPTEVVDRLRARGIVHRGWLENFLVPEVFARHRVTVHVPRRPYVEALPGIPTIRPFEAMACGIPLVCAPWDDAEGLFHPGEDYLVAGDGAEMRTALRAVLNDPALAQALAGSGRRTILSRHTCAHRVDELLAVCAELGLADHAQRSTEPRARNGE